MYKLPESLDIYQIDELRQDLIDYLEEKIKKEASEIILDAENTEDIDASGIQLLLSFYKTVTKENLKFSIINKGDIFKRLILLSGVKEVWGEEYDE